MLCCCSAVDTCIVAHSIKWKSVTCGNLASSPWLKCQSCDFSQLGLGYVVGGSSYPVHKKG